MHRWLIQDLQRRPRWDLLALLARLAAGPVFVGFGLGKFFRHEAERDAFERYEIPFPDAATYLVGSLELSVGWPCCSACSCAPSPFCWPAT